jgi:hypothetical protein
MKLYIILPAILFYLFMPGSIKAQDAMGGGERVAFTIGLLKGGGSLIGVDVEALLTDRIGLQAGLGLLGFGAGLNYHLSPRINSSFFQLTYWNQGLGDHHMQKLLGPSFVFRAKKILAAQLGLGYVLEMGPGMDNYLRLNSMDRSEYPPVIITYSIGIFIPAKK